MQGRAAKASSVDGTTQINVDTRPLAGQAWKLARPWEKSSTGGVPRRLGVAAEAALLDTRGFRKPHSRSRSVFPIRAATSATAKVDDLASRFGSALVSRGLQKGDRVAIFSPNTPQFVIAYFGTLKAGGVVVPCSPLYKEKELEHQLRDAGASFVVAANDVVKGNDLFASLEACRATADAQGRDRRQRHRLPPRGQAVLAGLAGVKNVERTGHGPLHGHGQGQRLRWRSRSPSTL